MKRQRGRGRGGKPGGGGHHNHNYQNPNRSMESSGPEGAKVRGPAALVYERYLQYARDAASSGDRVLSENYLQHADHYFRLLRAMQPAMPVQPQGDRFGGEAEDEGDEDGAPEGEAVEAGAEDEQGEGEFAGQQGGQRQHAQQGGEQGQGDRNFDREGGDFRRRRGRRSRFRPDGEQQGEGGDQQREPREVREPREAREPREPRGERPPREPRQPREDRGEGGNREQSGPEGFSSGPKPAFLRSE